MNDIAMNIKEVEDMIYPYLPKETGYQKRVAESMNYSFFAGGKRLRPGMLLESYRSFGGTEEEMVAPFMAALEMIHTYSLIHDDLPAMDNDDYRRGKLTNHKMFDEATAILAGDGLLNLAFETMLEATTAQTDLVMMRRMTETARVIASKAGIHGMIGGQTADMEGEKKSALTEEELLFIHENKTAALIQAALLSGAILAGAGKDELDKLNRIGYLCGVAFQIQDDILDCVGDEAILGKPVGSDDKNEKFTYVTLKGLHQAEHDQKEMTEEAVRLLKEMSLEHSRLNEIIMGLIDRKK